MFRHVLALSVAVCLGYPTLAVAQWPALTDVPAVEATGSRDVAVIVAVEDYLLLPDIPGAVDNANDWEVFFRNGLQIPNVHVLANQDVTRESMLKFARTAAADVGEGGTVWWIFVGHGAPAIDGKDGLLVGVDAQQSVESLAARGLPQDELLGALQTPRSRTVMIVDACFSGRAQNGEALAAGVQPVVAVDPTARLAGNAVVLSAAKATEVAGQLEGATRPAFSYLMLGALRGWADANDGQVTAAEALHFTQRKLRGVKGRQQTPQASGDVTLVLARGVKEKSPRVVAEGVEPASKVVEEKAPPAGGTSKAELTLEYLQRRIVFEGKVARQAGRILDGPAFYHAIGRPDLAGKWRSNKPVMWISGIALMGFGGVAIGFGTSKATNDTVSDSAQTGWFVAGSLVGSFSIIGGILATVFGFVGDSNPMSYAERRSAAEGFNQTLRDERGLGPEADWQNEQVSGRFSPLSHLTFGVSGDKPTVGFSFRF